MNELFEQLKSDKWWVRENAADALGASGDERAVDPLLVAALHDSETSVQTKAARAIQQIGKPAIGPLVAHLRDTDNRVRLFAVRNLGYIGDEQSLEPLITMVSDLDVEIRRAVIGAIANVQPSAISRILSMLCDDSSCVRRNAAWVMGELRCTDAVASLITMLNDQDWLVRADAADALGAVGDRRAVAPLKRLLCRARVPFSLRLEESFFLDHVVSALAKMGENGHIPWWWEPLWV